VRRIRGRGVAVQDGGGGKVGDLTTLQCHGVGASAETTWKQKKRKA